MSDSASTSNSNGGTGGGNNTSSNQTSSSGQQGNSNSPSSNSPGSNSGSTGWSVTSDSSDDPTTNSGSDWGGWSGGSSGGKPGWSATSDPNDDPSAGSGSWRSYGGSSSGSRSDILQDGLFSSANSATGFQIGPDDCNIKGEMTLLRAALQQGGSSGNSLANLEPGDGFSIECGTPGSGAYGKMQVSVNDKGQWEIGVEGNLGNPLAKTAAKHLGFDVKSDVVFGAGTTYDPATNELTSGDVTLGAKVDGGGALAGNLALKGGLAKNHQFFADLNASIQAEHPDLPMSGTAYAGAGANFDLATKEGGVDLSADGQLKTPSGVTLNEAFKYGYRFGADGLERKNNSWWDTNHDTRPAYRSSIVPTGEWDAVSRAADQTDERYRVEESRGGHLGGGATRYASNGQEPENSWDVVVDGRNRVQRFEGGKPVDAFSEDTLSNMPDSVRNVVDYYEPPTTDYSTHQERGGAMRYQSEGTNLADSWDVIAYPDGSIKRLEGGKPVDVFSADSLARMPDDVASMLEEDQLQVAKQQEQEREEKERLERDAEARRQQLEAMRQRGQDGTRSFGRSADIDDF